MGESTAISISKIPFPAPNHKKSLVFMDNHKKGPQNSIVSSTARRPNSCTVLSAPP